jgi:hypothetical protein
MINPADAEAALAAIFAKLAEADRTKALQNLAIFGAFHLYEREDGTVELLDPVRLSVGVQPRSKPDFADVLKRFEQEGQKK